ncbi:hypothetical protein BU17DRAFT_68149 [Hysterangium stoloniferum]|nr:hypothetical protein BU17DRAFT_68149 [Hysterangium stoloniferum]
MIGTHASASACASSGAAIPPPYWHIQTTRMRHNPVDIPTDWIVAHAISVNMPLGRRNGGAGGSTNRSGSIQAGVLGASATTSPVIRLKTLGQRRPSPMMSQTLIIVSSGDIDWIVAHARLKPPKRHFE